MRSSNRQITLVRIGHSEAIIRVSRYSHNFGSELDTYSGMLNLTDHFFISFSQILLPVQICIIISKIKALLLELCNGPFQLRLINARSHKREEFAYYCKRGL